MSITAFDVGFLLLSVALMFAFYRLARGPRALDRVVALELISLLSIGLILVHSAQSDTAISLDIAVILAVVAFLGTVTFAYYLERGRRA